MNTAIIILLILGMVPWKLTLNYTNEYGDRCEKIRYLNWIINGIALVLFIIKIKGV